MLDFIRIGCAVPAVKVGDTAKNARDICIFIEEADEKNCDLLLFPELSVTGYTCQDLFYQQTLLDGAKEALKQIAACSAAHPHVTVVVGLPVSMGAGLYNCAAIISGGIVRGLVPKTFMADDSRQFLSGSDLVETYAELDLGYPVAIGTDLLFQLGEGTRLGVEICQDLLVPLPASTLLCLGGAEVVVNLSASPALATSCRYREDLVKHQSGACRCIYVYCSAGYTESTQDMVYSGQSVIAENGKVLGEKSDLSTDYLLIRDCDLGKIRADRRKDKTFTGCAQSLQVIPCSDSDLRGDGDAAPIAKLPFIPDCKDARTARCLEIFQTQVTGLKQRLSVIGTGAVIGVSGGLDSTLALLVAAEAMRQLGRPSTDIYGVTMPCFGTSDRTYQNSLALMSLLGVNSKEINIKEAVTGHFRDIGHDISVHNGTYENSQARERTQILMDYASVVGGIVVGTGDLSELALGWCTYNGDHMSMYGVNATVPKTLIRWIITAVAELPAFAPAKAVLEDILDTPISPELLPPDAAGKISQQTEDIVGPYALHDFYLYYLLRYGFSPKKIHALACRAFREDFDSETITKWLKIFLRRFFTQQFKRNCVPDGVKVGTVGLGPRGDFSMPSDATARLWLDEVETL